MSDWKTISVKITPDMHVDIQDYLDAGDFDSLGAAVRDLISHGLETALGLSGVQQKVIRANAAAAAKRRLHILMTAATQAFAKDYELEGEDQENLDTQFTYEDN